MAILLLATALSIFMVVSIAVTIYLLIRTTNDNEDLVGRAFIVFLILGIILTIINYFMYHLVLSIAGQASADNFTVTTCVIFGSLSLISIVTWLIIEYRKDKQHDRSL